MSPKYAWQESPDVYFQSQDSWASLHTCCFSFQKWRQRSAVFHSVNRALLSAKYGGWSMLFTALTLLHQCYTHHVCTKNMADRKQASPSCQIVCYLCMASLMTTLVADRIPCLLSSFQHFLSRHGGACP